MSRYKWAKRSSDRGNTYAEIEDTMPIINYMLLGTVVYIYPSLDDARNGVKVGATGFMLAVESVEHDFLYHYVVTNAHCIEEAERMGATSFALRFNTATAGETDQIDTPFTGWIKHPDGDDLAVYPLQVSPNWYGASFSEIWLLPREAIQYQWVGVGDETMTIGRYKKHDGRLFNTPAVRFGRISMLPFQPINVPERQFDQESFLVETHSISGYSGSPVTVNIPPDGRVTTEPAGTKLKPRQDYLLGVDWGHFDFKGELIEQGKVKVPSGMMCVVPAWKLKELLHIEVLEMQRKEFDKEFSRAKNDKYAPSLDSDFSVEKVLKNNPVAPNGKEAFDELLKRAAKPKK